MGAEKLYQFGLWHSYVFAGRRVAQPHLVRGELALFNDSDERGFSLGGVLERLSEMLPLLRRLGIDVDAKVRGSQLRGQPENEFGGGVVRKCEHDIRTGGVHFGR